MVIHDGYAVISYDFYVIPSDANCLFNMSETLSEKEARLLHFKSQDPDELKSEIEKNIMDGLKKKASAAIDDFVGLPLGLGDKMADLDMNSMFEGVKPFL